MGLRGRPDRAKAELMSGRVRLPGALSGTDFVQVHDTAD